jgi:hypothetical protein
VWWEDDAVKRGLKLGFGIPILLLGLFMTLGGVALLVLVGTDGTFTLSATDGETSGNALVLETLDLNRNLASSGSFAATATVSIGGHDGDVFVGIGPAADVARYLRGAQVDRITQVNWPGGLKTEPEHAGTRTPPPPQEQSFWAAKAEGPTATLLWTVQRGDWTMVIMNADASAGVSVTASGSLGMPALGPISVGLLVAGLAILVGGILLTISGSRTPKAHRTAPPPRPDGVVAA